MRTIKLMAAALILAAGGCAASRPGADAAAAPETVMVTYHVKAGHEQDVAALLNHAWEIYLSKRLVFSRPHVIVQGSEPGGPVMIETFTWASHTAPEQAPESIKSTWSDLGKLCEARNGKPAIDGGEVQLIAPRPGALFP